MTTTPTFCGGLSGAASDYELELRSKRLGRGSKGTPKLSRSDDSSSPFVATPSAPQRFSRTTTSSGVHVDCVADTSSAIGLCRDDGKLVSVQFGDKVVDSLNKDLLVVALEEENDRLRSALGAARRARQLAEAEANLQSARALEYENKSRALESQLAEAHQKLADLEKAALSRGLVQNWLETTIPQRRGSAGLSPEEYVEAYSAVLTEPELCPKRASESFFGAVEVTEAAKVAPGPTYSGLGYRSGVSVDGETFGKLFEARHLSGDIDSNSGSDTDKELLDSRGGCCGRPLAPGNGKHALTTPYGGAGAFLPPHITSRVGYPADAIEACASGSFSGAWTRPTWSPSLQHACTPGGDSGSSAGLTPAWSLPLQGEDCLPLLPTLLHVDSSRPPVVKTPSPAPQGHRLLRLQLDSNPLVGNVAPPSHTSSTAKIWLPARVAACHSWGLGSPHCGVELSPPQQSAARGSTSLIVPSASAPDCPQLQTFSTSQGPPISQRQQPHHHPPAHLHHSYYPQPRQVLSSPILRVPPERAASSRRLLAGNSALCLDAFGTFGGDVWGSSIQSYGSVPVVCVAQDGSEWCNIPLGSPECTPRKDAACGSS